jgi:hypothetical protein
MPKCFLTGIEIPMENAYLLDCGAAQRALRNLKLRVAAVERIMTQLSPKDQTEAWAACPPPRLTSGCILCIPLV